MSEPIDPASAGIFETVGEDGIRRLVRAFYCRIPDDALLGPMYFADGLAAAEKHLADFLIYRFGGPDTYPQQRGSPRLRIRHVPFAITTAARDRWVHLIDTALKEVDWPGDIVNVVQPFLHNSATFLINQPQ